MKKTMKRLASLALVLTMALTLASCGGGQPSAGSGSAGSSGSQNGGSGETGPDFPNQTLTVICPYAAGGGTDVILRALCDSASKIALPA